MSERVCHEYDPEPELENSTDIYIVIPEKDETSVNQDPKTKTNRIIFFPEKGKNPNHLMNVEFPKLLKEINEMSGTRVVFIYTFSTNIVKYFQVIENALRAGNKVPKDFTAHGNFIPYFSVKGENAFGNDALDHLGKPYFDIYMKDI